MTGITSDMSSAKPPVNAVFATQDTTIFTVMSDLAAKHDAINLGQGFPDIDGPEAIRRHAAQRLIDGPNQYAPSHGVPELRQAVAAHAASAYGLEYDWQTEVMVTSGATEALSDCLLALLSPGDEAVIIEPSYDCYLPIIERAGAIARFVPLDPPGWALPRDRLEAAFSDKTKLIVVNTPMNPCSKVFSADELDVIAGLCVKHNAYAVCDEVYENLLFDNHAHLPLAARPGMFERTVRIGSAGKTFSFTGWKIGYVSGPAEMMTTIYKAHQYLVFASAPALQYAVAFGLTECGDFVAELRQDLQAKRDFLRQTLEGIGLETLPCEATYFLTADISSRGFDGDDMAFCEMIAERARVVAIPLSAFYHPGSKDAPRSLLRFCFSKRTDVLEEAARRLEAAFRDSV